MVGLTDVGLEQDRSDICVVGRPLTYRLCHGAAHKRHILHLYHLYEPA